MLTHIEIDNYKSVAHASLSFQQENVIVGPNGVGKSNLLDAMHFVRDAVNDGLDHAVTKRHGINSIRRWSKTKPYNVSLKLSFSSGGQSGSYRLSIASSAGDFSVLEEEAIWHGGLPLNLDTDDKSLKRFQFFRKGDRQIEFDLPDSPFNVGKLSLPIGDLAMGQMSPRSTSPFSLFFGRLHAELAACGAYSIYPNRIREPQAISNSEVLFDDGSNLASIIRQMRSTSFRANREQLTLAIRQVLPIVQEIRIESAGGFFVPVFRVSDNDDGYLHDLNMSQISDGTLRMLGMLTAFYQPRAPKRITLEEPEQMIHPGLLPILVDASRDFLDSKTKDRQTFFTTHSPTLLDQFDPASIIAAGYEAGVTTFKSLVPRQLDIIKDHLFTAGELLVAEGLFQ